MGGLAAEITEKEFGDYFAKFGVVKVKITMRYCSSVYQSVAYPCISHLKGCRGDG